MLRRFLCALFGHATLPGVRRDMSIWFECQRCRQVQRGGLGFRRR